MADDVGPVMVIQHRFYGGWRCDIGANLILL